MDSAHAGPSRGRSLAPKDVALSDVCLRRQSAPARPVPMPVNDEAHQAVVKALQAPGHDAFKAYAVTQMHKYLADPASGRNVELSDVERILARRLPPSVMDNVGDAALSSTYVMTSSPISLLGYMFWAANGVANGAVKMSGSALHYNEMRREAERERARLQTAQTLAAHTPGMEATATYLQERIEGLDKLRRSMQLAFRRRLMGAAVPGMGQLIASSAMLVLQIDLAPTLGAGHALLPKKAGVILGCICGGILGLYGLAWTGKNATTCYQAWSTPKIDPSMRPEATALNGRITKYLECINKSISQQRIYTGINTLLSLVYTTANAGLLASNLGADIGPKQLWTLLGLASTGYLISEYRWGRRFTAHNMATPHLDRNYLNNQWHREEALHVLKSERSAMQTTVEQIIALLDHDTTFRGLNPWHHLSYKHRYAVWGALGFAGRLGAWTRDKDAQVDPLVRDFMVAYTRLEKASLCAKLRAMHIALRASECEMELGHAAPEVAQAHREDTDRMWILGQKLVAMDGLITSLQSIDLAGARKADDKPWNAARLNFLLLNRLMPMFFGIKDVKAHADWFDITHVQGWTGKHVREAHIHPLGLTLAAKHFDAAMEKRFVNLLLTPEIYRYERDAVIEEAKASRRKRPAEVHLQLAQTPAQRYSFKESPEPEASATKKTLHAPLEAIKIIL